MNNYVYVLLFCLVAFVVLVLMVQKPTSFTFKLGNSFLNYTIHDRVFAELVCTPQASAVLAMAATMPKNAACEVQVKITSARQLGYTDDVPLSYEDLCVLAREAGYTLCSYESVVQLHALNGGGYLTTSLPSYKLFICVEPFENLGSFPKGFVLSHFCDTYNGVFTAITTTYGKLDVMHANLFLPDDALALQQIVT